MNRTQKIHLELNRDQALAVEAILDRGLGGHNFESDASRFTGAADGRKYPLPWVIADVKTVLSIITASLDAKRKGKPGVDG